MICKYNIRIIAAVLIAVIFTAMTGGHRAVYAENTDDVLKQSIILKGKTSYYYKYGEKTYFDAANKSYAPEYNGNDISLSIPQLKELFDFEYEYDKNTEILSMHGGNIDVTCKLGEDALFVNGHGVYMPETVRYNGTRVLLPVCSVARAFGYYTDKYGDIVIISKNSAVSESFSDYKSLDELLCNRIIDEDFSNLKFINENLSTLPNYYITTESGSNKETCGYFTESEGPCFYAEASDEKYSGLLSKLIKFDKNDVCLRFSFDCRKSSDYSGGKPVFMLFFYSGKTLTDIQSYDGDDISEKWNGKSIDLKNDMFPKNDADGVRFLTGTAKTDGPASGRVFFKNFKTDCFKPVSKQKKQLELAADDMFFDGLFKENFENNPDITYQSWSKTGGGSISADVSYDGERSVYLDAVQSGMTAFMMDYIQPDPPQKRTNYENVVKAKVYATEDYAQNVPFALFSMRQDGKYSRLVYGLTTDKSVLGQWTEMTFKFPYRVLYRNDLVRSSPNNSFAFGIGTKASGVKETSPGKGRLYFDSVRLEKGESKSQSTSLSVVPKNKISWYVLGDTVTYAPGEADKDRLSEFNRVLGRVTDIDGNTVFEKIIPADEMKNSGWSWKPEETAHTGSFSAEFFGIRSDGTVSAFETLLNAEKNEETYQAGKTKHRFIVAAHETKPWEQRNTFNGININSDDVLGLALADKIGFSAVRYHWLLWGNSQLFSGAHKAPGLFDWAIADKVFAAMSENKMSFMVNIFGSPKWALPDEFQGVTGGMVAGGMKYNGYGVQNQNYVRDFFNAYLERYGERTDIIEFWNEPGSSSAFWYDHDNDDVLILMLKTVSECVKNYNREHSADIKIAFAGFMPTQTAWLEKFMSSDADIGKYYDIFSIHGNYSAPAEIYEKLLTNTVIEKKPWINSESYSTSINYARSGSEKLTDFSLNSLSGLMNYFYHIKAGASQLYDFRTTCDIDDEYAAALARNGIYTEYWGYAANYLTHIEPIPLAYVLHVFFELMGSDFSYKAEYDLPGGQAAVRFESDGKPVIALWNRDETDFSVCREIKSCFTENTEIIDFEGHAVNADKVLKGNKLYWITGVSETDLNTLAPSDKILNPDNIEPYYNARTTAAASTKSFDELTVAKGGLTKGKLFDEKSFNIVNDNINWVESDWNWVSTGNYEQPGDFDAKFAAAYEQNGLYLMVSVNDSLFCMNEEAGKMTNYWNYDGIQFAIDTNNSGNPSNRMEFAAAQTSNGTMLRKSTAPDVGEILLTGYTKSGEFMNDNYVNISDTQNGKLYKIFVPISELYPMEHPLTSDCLRLSVLVNNNDSYGRMGYLEWSSGIGSAKNPSLYGALK